MVTLPAAYPRLVQEVRRVAILFSRLSGYMVACLRALKEQHGVELLVIRYKPAENAPFDEDYFKWIDHLYDRDELTGKEITALLAEFAPDAVLMSGWMDAAYLAAARSLKAQNVPIIAGSDAQWNGSVRQRAGQILSHWYLRSAIDVLWVSGERQRQLGQRLGFAGPHLWPSGIYACDWTRFADIYTQHAGRARPKAFLFVGRYVPIKGLDVLVEAYAMYRARVSDPWPLLCAGAGEHKALLEGREGIIDRGFVQPEALPALMAEASAFVLPSRREPWGVVIQEAAAAGLPLVCTDACGAGVHLLQDQYNGFQVERGNARHLTQALERMSALSPDQWTAMSDRSHTLSRQFTPERWAATLVGGVASFQPERA